MNESAPFSTSEDNRGNQGPGEPAFFFDRDGVINEPPRDPERYIRAWKHFRFSPGILDVLAEIKRAGYKLVLITNQQGVAKGLMDEAELQALHASMQEALAAVGGSFDAIYAAVGWEGKDSRRKPSPAMFYEAAADHSLDLARSWMVGDHDNDIRAARSAGVGTIRWVGLKEVRESSDFQVHTAEELRSLLPRLRRDADRS